MVTLEDRLWARYDWAVCHSVDTDTIDEAADRLTAYYGGFYRIYMKLIHPDSMYALAKRANQERFAA